MLWIQHNKNYFLPLNNVFGLSLYRSIFDFFKIFRLSSSNSLSFFWDNNSCIRFSGTFVITNCTVGTLFLASTLEECDKLPPEQRIHVYLNRSWDYFHCFIMMKIFLKSLLSCFLHGLWALVLPFWKVWVHICHCFVLIVKLVKFDFSIKLIKILGSLESKANSKLLSILLIFREICTGRIVIRQVLKSCS